MLNDLTSSSLFLPLGLFIALAVALVLLVWNMVAELTHRRLKSRPLNTYQRTRRKAKAGDPKACMACAEMLEKGTGGAPDKPHLIHYYLNRAFTIWYGMARQGDGYAALKLAEICNFGHTYPKFSKYADRAYRAALAVNEANAAAGDINGCAYAGYQYRYGLGCATDYDTAAMYLERAADMGHAASMKLLADLYLNGLKPRPDPVTAARLVRQAALIGDPEALERVGDNHLDNTGEVASRELAYCWYALAARKGRRQAMRKLETLEQDWTPKQLRDIQDRLATFVPA
ncbi:tetratricopeptide repeat protein [Asticcacaulis solisilvae]|uniref:tetratricopeptide repeat protein n=1 Tax=Asticcacaulis solisilvae TaxID=1217274 RepID=UPI003FD7992E